MSTPSFDLHPARISREAALALTPAQKLAYFKAVRLQHPRTAEVSADLELMAQPGSGTDIALLIGPTGVGKSTLVDGLKERMILKFCSEIEEDPSFIPVVSVEAPSSGERGFSWRMFYLRLGEALQEPLLEKKQETRLKDGRLAVHYVSTGSTVTGLRVAIEKALLFRRTSLVIVDEAVHLLRNLHGNTLETHMDALKSLANICGVTLALVGSYDLYQLMDLSGQLARRTAILHFQRYLSGVEADEMAFRNTLRQLQHYMPLEGMGDLQRHALDLRTACVGCVGILKDTLTRALAFALNQGGTWSEGFLEKALLSEGQLEAILHETLTGEARIRRTTFGTGTFKAMAQASREVECRTKGAA